MLLFLVDVVLIFIRLEANARLDLQVNPCKYPVCFCVERIHKLVYENENVLA